MSLSFNGSGGEDETVFESPIGRLRLRSRGEKVTQLEISRAQKRPPRTSFQKLVTDQILKYLEGDSRKFDFDLAPSGTDFERKVWSITSQIEYGQRLTYAEVAHRIGKPGAARAVGRAMGKNPILLMIPCHRVVASNGGLGGFSCGIRKKKWLLSLEAPVRA